MSTEDKSVIWELMEFLLDEQLRISNNNIKFRDIIKLDQNIPWYEKYKITKAQEEEFKEICIEKIKNTLNLSDEDAELEFFWFNTTFGLERKEDEVYGEVDASQALG